MNRVVISVACLAIGLAGFLLVKREVNGDAGDHGAAWGSGSGDRAGAAAVGEEAPSMHAKSHLRPAASRSAKFTGEDLERWLELPTEDWQAELDELAPGLPAALREEMKVLIDDFKKARAEGLAGEDPVFADRRNHIVERFHGVLRLFREGRLNPDYLAWDGEGGLLVVPYLPSESRGGIGARFIDGVMEVVGVGPGSPAARSGIVVGDRIVEVDGSPVVDGELTRLVELVRGPVGEPLVLTVQKKAGGGTVKVDLVREDLGITYHADEALEPAGSDHSEPTTRPGSR